MRQKHFELLFIGTAFTLCSLSHSFPTSFAILLPLHFIITFYSYVRRLTVLCNGRALGHADHVKRNRNACLLLAGVLSL